MSEIDLTEAVDAAARAWYDEGRPMGIAEYDAVLPAARHRVSESLLPAVAAAAPVIEAQVRASIAAEIDRATAVRWFRPWIAAMVRAPMVQTGMDLADLAGRDLACWCKTTDSCHADVLLELCSLANGDPS